MMHRIELESKVVLGVVEAIEMLLHGEALQEDQKRGCGNMLDNFKRAAREAGFPLA